MKKKLLLLCLTANTCVFSQVIYPGTATVGSQEIVFDYSTDKCNTIDIPDVPARAFRDASGTINLIASHYTNWRMIGTDFTSLAKDCNPVMTSDLDTDPSKFNNNEWIMSTYTEDGTTVHALIHDEYVPCGNWNNCWYNAITYASSSDGGQTYTHSAAPSHLVAASPYESPYPSTHSPFGIFGGSNIIKKDGYYYKMVQLEAYQLQDWGAGIIRTDDLSDPTSWRGWDGTGFNVVFVNPYTETGYDPADKVLAPVSRDQIGKMCASITYNTYFGKYMVVDYTIGEVNGTLKYGFYYSLSDDLIHWSNKRLILQTTSSWAAGGSNYPSIIDHNDTSRNFENAGQTCYLYFTKWNSGTYDRDLIRVPVTFNKEIVTSFVINSTGDAGDATPGDGLCKTTGNVCTLRAALEEANARPPYDLYSETAIPLTFNITGSGEHTILPNAYLPEIFYPVSIDGYTQAGASENTNDFDQGLNAVITIKLDASNTGAHALAFHCGNNTVSGLSVIGGNVDFLYEEGYSTSQGYNTVKGCFIGMDTDGATPYDAVLNFSHQNNNTVGGTTNASRNLIGGGIVMAASDSNSVINNYIGTTMSGTASSGTGAHGVQIQDTSSYNSIGGTGTMEPNLISGGNVGISIDGAQAAHNEVFNNLIGVANDGVSGLGNQRAGIALTNGTFGNIITGNTIADNSTDEAGIWMDNTHLNLITSNYIGTSSDLTAVLGNGDMGTFSGGIMLMGGSSDNTIGGPNSSEGNVIANNNFGISLYSNAGTGNAFLSNLIYDNSEMAIDLEADYTPAGNDSQDSDSGPNDLQNYPVLSTAYVTSSQIVVSGTLNSEPNSSYTIQYFSNPSCDPSGNGEGKLLLGTETVTTNSSGNATLSGQFNVVVAAGSSITALATDGLNNTSEFSECVTAQSASAPSTPTITASGAVTFCQGQSVTLTSTAATSYLWSNGATTQTINVTTAGTYSVTVYNAQGLSATSAGTTVTVNSLPSIVIYAAEEICTGETTTLTASGANTFAWTGGPATASYDVSPLNNTTYTVTGTNTTTNCSNTVSQLITVNDIPTVTIAGDTIICNGDATLLTASGADSYVWTAGPSDDEYMVSPTGNTTYTVTGISNGCDATAEQQVIVNTPSVPTINESGSVLSSSASQSYQWNLNGTPINNETAQNYTPTQTGTYTVTTVDDNGCEATSSDFNYTVGLVTLKNKLELQVVPNPSTGKFTVLSDNGITGSVKVFNAAGSLIYSSSAFTKEIDLTGQQRGVYFLKIETTDRMYVKKLIVN